MKVPFVTMPIILYKTYFEQLLPLKLMAYWQFKINLTLFTYFLVLLEFLIMCHPMVPEFSNLSFSK